MPQLSFLPWLVALILCVPALFIVLYPLYLPYQRMLAGAHPESDEEHQAALPSQIEHEQAARSALTEVELDYQLGNLAEPDYRSLRERYLLRAYTAHKSIQAHEQQLDAQIEDRLRQMRGTEEYQDRDNAAE
ncbi:MAG TPA: hypothetical protein VGT44_15945 [Ktedonobacteraceae bacterium]|nr:hypothetical protein [Ktedonobacteraceae bacterium]